MKPISVLLSIVLAIGLMPAAAFASEESASLSAAPIMTQASAIDESEPNGSSSRATKISMNRFVYGQIANYEDEDYYKVTLPQAGSIKLVFYNGRHLENDDDFYIEVINRYHETVGSFHASSYYTRPVSELFNVPKGACWIYVTSGADKAHPYHFKLTYNIPSTTVTKVTAAKKAFTAKWTKKSGALKYQLRYSVNKNMSKAKIVNASTKYGSKKITNLKAKKKYWVQVRVAKKIGSQTYWSSWSGKKAVTTKK